MSGSQRTSNIYAREALIEIDYGDLCEDLKVRFKPRGWGHLPSCPERGSAHLGALWRQTMSGKKGKLARGWSCDLGSPLICTHRHRHIFYPQLPAAPVPACYQSPPSTCVHISA